MDLIVFTICFVHGDVSGLGVEISQDVGTSN
jgi:hypothetical protein